MLCSTSVFYVKVWEAAAVEWAEWVLRPKLAEGPANPTRLHPKSETGSVPDAITSTSSTGDRFTIPFTPNNLNMPKAEL